ncbi:MAG: class I SAM-dependent methyltransferase [Coleofasciculus sp. B1-GNL1-01]|uniref:class I SAM-dependent methyltransferase n=1 Tax=Coleofasciculus sp. B1-GNL1-01 TaxID=3068484 RepID=UPI003302E95B
MIDQSGLTASPVCPISGAEMKPWLFVPGDWRRPTVSKPFQLYWCQASQFGRVYPVPDPSEITSFYNVDEYYTHGVNPRSSDSVSSVSFLERLRTQLAWRFDDGINGWPHDWFHSHFGSTSRFICEIGCGNGKLLEKLREWGHTVYGVEPDPQARFIAVEERGLQVFAGTAESLPPEISLRHYELVIIKHALEHTVDPVKAVSNAIKLLAPGGKLVIEVPNNSALEFKFWGIAWFHLDVPRHLNFFTKYSLHKLCEQLELKLCATEFYGYCRQFTKHHICIEQKIAEILCSLEENNESPQVKNFNLKSWLLLLQSAFAANEQKYDCVRVIAEKPNGQPTI